MYVNLERGHGHGARLAAWIDRTALWGPPAPRLHGKHMFYTYTL